MLLTSLGIENLWAQFSTFPSTAVAGVTLDLQPHYWHSLRDYRYRTAGTGRHTTGTHSKIMGAPYLASNRINFIVPNVNLYEINKKRFLPTLFPHCKRLELTWAPGENRGLTLYPGHPLQPHPFPY
jgi:hypothetical protein